MDPSIVITFATLVGLILVGSLIIAAVRRWLRRDGPAQSFTFQDLREMRTRGDITEDEFVRMRAAMLAQMGAGNEPSKPTPPDPAGPDLM